MCLNTKQWFLFDSCCSASLCSSKFFEPETCCSTTFNWIDNKLKLQSIGTTVLNLQFENKQKLTWKFHVLKNIDCNIIGVDAMKKHGIILDILNKSVTFTQTYESTDVNNQQMMNHDMLTDSSNYNNASLFMSNKNTIKQQRSMTSHSLTNKNNNNENFICRSQIPIIKVNDITNQNINPKTQNVKGNSTLINESPIPKNIKTETRTTPKQNIQNSTRYNTNQSNPNKKEMKHTYKQEIIDNNMKDERTNTQTDLDIRSIAIIERNKITLPSIQTFLRTNTSQKANHKLIPISYPQEQHSSLLITPKSKKKQTVDKKTVREENISWPTQLAGYQIGKIIGEGNFAKVRKCHEITTGHQFALKIIHDIDHHKNNGS